MSTNETPKDLEGLIGLAENMADGLHTDAAGVGIAQNTEAAMRAAISAARNADVDYGAAKEARMAATALTQAADDEARDFLLAAKRVLSQFLGTNWSTAWESTGFPNQSTKVPVTQDQRLNLCATLKIYFTNNPTREVAALGVTALLAEAKYQALSDGRDAVEHKMRDQAGKKEVRDVAVTGLRKRVRGLIDELTTLLDDTDIRWHVFGLNCPADPDTPEPVTELTLAMGAAGVIVASWPRAMRATRYRPYTQIVGVDEAPIAHDPVHDEVVNLPGFAAGQTVKVFIIAANDAGEAQPGPTEEILIP
ncbi:MAG: hypothetical protein NTY53_24250 [Kiritimatiellaeota bacterium]|nr:hypothetical protein [Kiritimatiellota bacterium]